MVVSYWNGYNMPNCSDCGIQAAITLKQTNYELE